MKITVYALAFAATLSRANASKKGFNVQVTLADARLNPTGKPTSPR
jgi:hypothetical protein